MQSVYFALHPFRYSSREIHTTYMLLSFDSFPCHYANSLFCLFMAVKVDSVNIFIHCRDCIEVLKTMRCDLVSLQEAMML
jgi:hypothetical protein